MPLGDIEKLHNWLENREPLMAEFRESVARSHKEPWPNFVITGLSHDISKGVMKPSFKGVPAGSHNAGGGDGPDRPTLVELISRVTAVRSRRWYTITQTVKPIPPAWSSLTREAFPFLCHLAVSDGWSDLIIAMSSWIVEIGVPPGYRADQIKEKYGSLRWYDNNGDEQIDKIVTAGEWLSYSICETCGAPGKERPGGWISTKCDKHA